MANKKISLFYSQKQWAEIDTRIEELGRKSTQHYIINQLFELNKIADECEDCFDGEIEKIRRVYGLPDNSIKLLCELSDKIKLPPSTIVSRFIINPLLIK